MEVEKSARGDDAQLVAARRLHRVEHDESLAVRRDEILIADAEDAGGRKLGGEERFGVRRSKRRRAADRNAHDLRVGGDVEKLSDVAAPLRRLAAVVRDRT